MYKEIKIGEKTVPMVANSSTPYRYKQVFHVDIMEKFTESLQIGESIDIMSHLGYLMAAQAKAADGDREALGKLSEEGFLDWMEQFEPGEVTSVASEIMKLYNGQKETTSKAKKKDVRQNDG